MKSYESSTTTLRMILSHPSLQRDKIDETMDALAEANEDARELDEVVRIGAIVASEEIAGDRDVELELDALVQEIEAEEKKRKELEEERLAEQLGRMQVPQEEPKEVQGIRQEAGLALT
jgi:charged multivesicular body protein 7